MVETLSSTSLIGVRDRALLLVGFAGAFGRSELVSLDVADVTFGGEGLIVQLRRSKTDQEAEGRKVGLPFGSNPLTCPVRSLRAWLDVAVIARGPIDMAREPEDAPRWHQRPSASSWRRTLRPWS